METGKSQNAVCHTK